MQNNNGKKQHDDTSKTKLHMPMVKRVNRSTASFRKKAQANFGKVFSKSEVLLRHSEAEQKKPVCNSRKQFHRPSADPVSGAQEYH